MTWVRFCGPGGRDAAGYGRQDAYRYRPLAVPEGTPKVDGIKVALLPEGKWRNKQNELRT